MGSGVIIDDGGSTRIKWNDLESGSIIRGKLESLMDVREEGGTGISSQEIHEKEPYTQIRITYLDSRGQPLIDETLSVNMRLLVQSHLRQNVEIERIENGLAISLFGDEVGPIVEARQHNRMRRYIVTNSGPIEKIFLDSGGNRTEIYNAATVLPDEARRPVIYTSVVLY